MNNGGSLNNRSLGSNTAKVLAPVLAMFCLGAERLAQGTMTIGFEGQMSPLGGYRESGMVFGNAFGGPEVLRLYQSGWSGCPDNGTSYLGSGGLDLLVFRFDMFPTTYFNLLSFDIAEPFPGPSTLQVIGYPGQSQPVTNTITTDGIMDGPGGQQDFQTFYFGSTFERVNRIEIAADRWCLGNVVIGGVPEPSTGALMLLAALCALGRCWLRTGRI